MKAKDDCKHKHSYWLNWIKRSTPLPSPCLPKSVDVVVVGSGVTGLAAALRLSQKGLRVIVVDKYEISSGSSTRNAGIMVLGYKLSPKTMVKRFGLDNTIAFYRMELEAFDFVKALAVRERIDCDYFSDGHVELASKKRHVAELDETANFFLKYLSHELKLLNKHEIKNHIHTKRYFGGTYDPSGSSLNPGKYLQGLASGVTKAGGLLLPETPVVHIKKNFGNFDVSIGMHKVRTDKLVIATNAYSSDVDPWLKRRIVSVGSHMIATERLPSTVSDILIKENCTASDTNRFLCYFRLTPDRKRLLFGGRTRFSVSNGIKDMRSLRNSMIDVFPQLYDCGIDYTWSGNVAFTRDYLPHMGEYNGMHYALGYNGGGLAMGSYLGTHIADTMTGSCSDKLPISERRFCSFPLHYGNPWYLPLVHACYKFRDLIW